ncbi:MAG: class I SAM-dependent methyltransferase [Pyrinomonadaceae bacterium]|nr:class I SAM-dependent methyltransferase [Pyrinomonadaceae bacterium]
MTTPVSDSKWPKEIPALTAEQMEISDDWMKYFHEVNRTKFSGVVGFNHRYVAQHSPGGFLSTLDVGAGLGEHLQYESLGPEQLQNYAALEIRPEMADTIRENWPTVVVHGFDCQKTMPFADGAFDRIIAIHVLEHLPDLPAFLREARRLLRKGTGRLLVVIPCEGGSGYTLGRKFTSKRMFEARYDVPYEPFIAVEHVNQAREVLEELKALFCVEHRSFYPLLVPLVDINLCIGLTLRPL